MKRKRKIEICVDLQHNTPRTNPKGVEKFRLIKKKNYKFFRYNKIVTNLSAVATNFSHIERVIMVNGAINKC